MAKDSSETIITTVFNVDKNDNAYIGYMYGTAGSTTYDATHENKNDSTIKIAVDKWYEDNLKTNYENYLADTLFCGDKTLAESTIGVNNTAKGYGTNTTFYSSIERIRYSTGTTDTTLSTPTFECAKKADDTYSRYTVSEKTLTNGNKTNGNLTYPIGLLNVEEAVYAGAYKFGQKNQTYYLYNTQITSVWWFLSPDRYDISGARVWAFGYSVGEVASADFKDAYSIRPSINLKTEVLVSSGDGTKENPYTVKLS